MSARRDPVLVVVEFRDMSKASRRRLHEETEGIPVSPSRRESLWVYSGLIAAIAFIYAQVWFFDFVNFDDQYYLRVSPYVSSGLTLPGIKWALTTFYFVNWHPLTWLSYMLDVEIYGLNAGGFHVTNVLLHATASILLFRLLRRLTGAGSASAFVAALFAVHPLHVESVAWVSERKDVLCGVFFMLTLSAYAAYVRSPGVRRYSLVAIMFILGLMSKPMIVTLPFLLLLMDIWPLRRLALPGDTLKPQHQPPWRLLVEKAPLMLFAAASCYLTVRAQAANVAKLDVLPLSVRVANAASSYVGYVAKTIWPSRLAAFYPYPSVQSGWRMVACLLALLAVSLAVVRELRRRPHLAVGWFWYLGTLIPVIGLVQTGDQSMADRYTYIPIIGLFIMVAWSGQELVERNADHRVVVRGAAILVLFACVIAARAQTSHWRGTKELWARALAVTQDNYIAESGMGGVLLSEGKLDEAIVHYEKAVAITPFSAQTYNTLGAALMKHQYIEKALPYLVHAVELKPEYAEAHNNLGLALVSLGKIDQAIAHYEEALRIEPNYAEVLSNLAIALARLGRFDEALARFKESLRSDPDYADGHYNLAVALFQRGNVAEAIVHLRTALRLDPDNADARHMLSDLERAVPRT